MRKVDIKDNETVMPDMVIVPLIIFAFLGAGWIVFSALTWINSVNDYEERIKDLERNRGSSYSINMY